MNDCHPPFAMSLFERNPSSLGTLAYKVLNARSTATPLVLVHGLGAIGTVDWFPLADVLSKTRPVLVFDSRDIGSSTMPSTASPSEKPWSMQDLADDVIDLVKHKGWRRVDLLGFSMGGMIVQTLVVTPRLPFTVGHVILVGTSTKPPHSELLESMAVPPPGGFKSVEEKMKALEPSVLVNYDPDFVKNPANQELLRRRIIEKATTRRPLRTIERLVRAISKYDIRSKLPTIPNTLPVLLIHGKLDRSVYISEQRYITKYILHAKRLKTPSESYGHTWYDYFSLEFWENRINRFLDDDESLPVYDDNNVTADKPGKL